MKGALAVGAGIAATLYAARYTHLIPTYGYSHGDDPVALAAGVVVGWVTYRLMRWLAR